MDLRVVLVIAGCASTMSLIACKKDGDSGTMTPPGAPSAPGAAGDESAWRADLSAICQLAAAAPASLQQRLGLEGEVVGRPPSPFSRTHTKCLYQVKSGQLVIEAEINVRDLSSARRAFASIAPPTDYPGFGDEAFLVSVATGAEPLHSLVVRKSDVMIVMSSIATPGAMRSVLTSLFAEMGLTL